MDKQILLDLTKEELTDELKKLSQPAFAPSKSSRAFTSTTMLIFLHLVISQIV